MVCRESRALMDASLDRELDPQTDLALIRHLETCHDCRAAYESEVSRRDVARYAIPYYRAPKGLAARMRSAALGTKENEPAARRSLPARGWAAAAAAALVAAAAFMLGRQSVVPTPSGQIIQQEIVACHVRSLMASHLVDVVSTDRHTVKPWYSGKLNFSPPVADLSSRGYKLTGGRLDYVDGHPAAALVYRFRKHIINVFVWPSDSPASGGPQTTASIHGYNMVHWDGQGMTWWIVSDAEESGLEGLADDLRAPHG